MLEIISSICITLVVTQIAYVVVAVIKRRHGECYWFVYSDSKYLLTYGKRIPLDERAPYTWIRINTRDRDMFLKMEKVMNVGKDPLDELT